MTGGRDGRGAREGRDDCGNPPATGLSRRRLLACGAALVGTGSAVVPSTWSRFADTDAAAGTVRIDEDPTLNYTIDDQTQNNKASYEVFYQVEWVSDFDRIEVRVENLDDSNIGPETLTGYATEDSLAYPGGGGSDGGAENDTYEFQLSVYDGAGNVAIQRTTTDVADGDGTSEGDMGNADDPTIESVTVTDTTENQTTNYTVAYELAGADDSNFSEVVVTFDDTSNTWADATRRSSSRPTGSVSYSRGGTQDNTYEITVEVENENGLVVDSTTITDVADGDDL